MSTKDGLDSFLVRLVSVKRANQFTRRNKHTKKSVSATCPFDAAHVLEAAGHGVAQTADDTETSRSKGRHHAVDGATLRLRRG